METFNSLASSILAFFRLVGISCGLLWVLCFISVFIIICGCPTLTRIPIPR